MCVCIEDRRAAIKMLFNSFGYFLFLPIVWLLFWISPKRFSTGILLIASYVFYMIWKPEYGLLIFGLTIFNYILGLAIHHNNQHKKLALIVAIVGNLLTLGFFKYAYFVRDTANSVLSVVHQHVPDIPFEIILPLGISFFVFEFIHYITDVYKGGQPIHSFPQFALFASFFPTQIAGPIKRYQDFIPQLSLPKQFKSEYLGKGLELILFGLFKKVVFADNLAVIVQSTFDHPQLLSSCDMWLSVYAFAFQIYFDFSGYTDIARGSALLFGYKVPLNFNLPYLASSISDFWHRWHMSLSSWLRDYLYIPLGGSRGSTIATYRNLLLTMILGGLWHGASMHFMIWGAYQGLLLVMHKVFLSLVGENSLYKRMSTAALYKPISIFATFHLTCIGWVFFRASNMSEAIKILKSLFFIPGPNTVSAFSLSLPATSQPIVFLVLPVVLLVLFSGQIISFWTSTRPRPITYPIIIQAVGLAGMLCLLLVLSPDTSPRFIYFQF